MRTLFFTALLLFSPLYVFAAVDTSHIGFVNSSVWFDREPFFAGDQVRVYTALTNSTPADFSGVVTFYEGENIIDTADVSLERNGGFQVLWADWEPEGGTHTIRVVITDAVIIEQGGEPQQISLSEATSYTLDRFVDADTDGDGIGNGEDSDDDNDGILDSEDTEPLVFSTPPAEESAESQKNDATATTSTSKITSLSNTLLEGFGNIASSSIPVVTETVQHTASAVERFRESQSNVVDEQIKKVKQRINEDQAGFESIEEGESRDTSPFNQLQLLALTTAGFTLNNTIVFYIVGAAVLYFIVRKVLPWLYRIVRGRDV